MDRFLQPDDKDEIIVTNLLELNEIYRNMKNKHRESIDTLYYVLREKCLDQSILRNVTECFFKHDFINVTKCF